MCTAFCDGCNNRGAATDDDVMFAGFFNQGKSTVRKLLAVAARYGV